MHELAITESVLKIALDEAKTHNAEKILAINLSVGDYSGAVPSCVEEYFKVLSKGSMAEGARLIVNRVPAVIHCNSCDTRSPVRYHSVICPICGSEDITLVSGREFLIDSLEVE